MNDDQKTIIQTHHLEGRILFASEGCSGSWFGERVGRNALFKRLLFMVCLLGVGISGLGAENDQILKEVETEFQNGEYAHAIRDVYRLIRRNRGEPEVRAAARLRLAQFYDLEAGDLGKALKQYQYYRKLKDDEAVLDRVAMIEDELSQLSAITNLLHELESVHWSKLSQIELKALQQEIAEVRRDFPESLRMHALLFYAGVCFQELQQPGKACQRFSEALRLKPALQFYLPVTNRLQRAEQDNVVKRLAWASTTLLWTLLIITVVLFFVARPWQWVCWHHIGVLGGSLIVVNGALFGVLTFLPVEQMKAAIRIWQQTMYTQPVFLGIAPGEPGSEHLWVFFGYVCFGLIAVFLFNIASGRWKRFYLRAIAGFMFGVLLFGALMTRYWIMHHHEQSRWVVAEGEEGALSLNGLLTRQVPDPEVYILGDPHAYPGLDVESISNDLYFRQWVLDKTPFDQRPALAVQAQVTEQESDHE